MKLPVYNIVLGDTEGLTKMSLVEFPAVESEFMAFSSDEPMQFSLDEEQHIVFGCALRADYPIYRADASGEYYVVFSKDTIKQLYEKFMKEHKTSVVNLEHSADTDGVYMIQSFLKDSSNGISPVGFENVSDGSWFTAYKIENADVWDRVKKGEFNGFSVEMFGELELVSDDDSMDSLVDEILSGK